MSDDTAAARLDHSAAVIARTRRYIREIAAQVGDVYAAPEPRFTISYQGFPGAGTGGTAGLDAEAAERYIRALRLDNPLVGRYGVSSILVRVEIPAVTTTIVA